MKQTIYTLFLLSALALASCRKDKNDPDLKGYDKIQIDNYRSANGLSDMIKDTIGGDTTGMYYKIILPGDKVDAAGNPAKPLDYPDKIAFVYTLKTLDGKYVSSDTINNHFEDYLGHIAQDKLPLGLQIAVHNLLKYRGASMRVLIPSHLAYGTSGYGSGSSQNTNTKIGGNQSLDYYIHVIGNIPTDNQATYDDLVIKNFIAANNLGNYTRSSTGLYYRVLTPGTGTSIVTANTVITTTYTGQLFNGIIFDGANNGTASASLTVGNLVPGAAEGLLHTVAGTKISLLIPSGLAYGETSPTGIPVNSCLRFTFQVITTTP